MPKKESIPKVRFKDKSYQVLDLAGNSVKITDGKNAFIIPKDKARPTNKEARELWNTSRNAGRD